MTLIHSLFVQYYNMNRREETEETENRLCVEAPRFVEKY